MNVSRKPTEKAPQIRYWEACLWVYAIESTDHGPVILQNQNVDLKEHQDSREISKGLYDYTKRPKIILIVIPLSGLRTNDCTRDILPTLQVLKQILKE
jgi:hypothetical protein